MSFQFGMGSKGTFLGKRDTVAAIFFLLKDKLNLDFTICKQHFIIIYLQVHPTRKGRTVHVHAFIYAQALRNTLDYLKNFN